MAMLPRANSGRMYSWWWDSHISPKNSKWLQENLSDMDMKVKAMIKLIEEDADSFAKRAEMYYRKRPELMKLVEEFYRAYRALAERYDHATGALRQAHRTMAEAFPDQIPLMLCDEPEPCAPETFQRNKRNGKIFERSIKDISGYKERGSEKNSSYKKQDVNEIDDESKCLQEEVSRLSKENQNLKKQVTSQSSTHVDGAENEIEKLRDNILKLNSEKEEALLEYQQYLECISNREAEISRTHEELKKQNTAMMTALEEELQMLKEESFSKIKNLENNVVLFQAEKNVLQEKLSFLQEHKFNLEDKNLVLTKQIEAVNSNVTSLHDMVKELQDGNVELKKLWKKHEDEKVLHLENMENMSEKNRVLENSLADANVEIDGLRERIEMLEQSCDSLHTKISAYESEKTGLVSQVETIAKNMEQLTEQNKFLENSLFDVNSELEALKAELKGLEESYRSLSDKKSELLSEKNDLVTQVQKVSQSLGYMERMYVELQDKHSKLEKEKDSTQDQVAELENLLKCERQEHDSLSQLNYIRLVTLENQINILQEESRVKDETIKSEEQKSVKAQIQGFVLQQCLFDAKDKNLVLSEECRNLLSKANSAERRISHLEQEHILLEEKIAVLLKQNETLKEGVHLILDALNIRMDDHLSYASPDESLLHLILSEIRGLSGAVSHSQCENEYLNLEKSILSTFLEQFGLDMASLKLEKETLKKNFIMEAEELKLVQQNHNELQTFNEKLKQDLISSDEKTEKLEAEKQALCLQLSDLQESHHLLFDVNDSLSRQVCDMREKTGMLEEDNTTILAETMNLDLLCLVFKNYNAEKALEMEALVNDLNSLHMAKSSLDQQVKQMTERLGALKGENIHLKASIVNLETDLSEARSKCDQLHIDVSAGKNLLVQKDMDILRSYRTLEVADAKNKELAKKIDDHKLREEHLTQQLNKGITEIQKCEQEIAALLHDNQSSSVHAIVLQEKLLELLVICERLELHAMVQREVLLGGIASSKCYMDQMKNLLISLESENKKLKADLDEYLPIITSLYRSIAALEDTTRSMAHYTSTDFQCQDDMNGERPIEIPNGSNLAGVMELQKLHTRVEALQQVLLDTKALLEKERLENNGTLSAAKKEIEMLKSRGRSDVHMSGIDAILLRDIDEKVKDDEVAKDIPLDHISCSPYESHVGSYGPSVEKDTVIDDEQMLHLWEMANGRDLRVGRVKKKKNIHPSSEIVLEKEYSVDKVNAPKKIKEQGQDWTRKIIERLDSDAERLSLLQTNAEELKRIAEYSDITNGPLNFEFEMVKAQLKEAESAISQLIDYNNILRRKAENYRSSTDICTEEGKVVPSDRSRRHISERARRVSEKIANLELELQKIQYILLKLEEKYKYKKARAADRYRRVMLKDYLYGTQESRRERKGSFCACARPSTYD